MEPRLTRNITLGLLAAGASVWAIYEIAGCDDDDSNVSTTGGVYHGGAFVGGRGSSGGDAEHGSVRRGGFGGTGAGRGASS